MIRGSTISLLILLLCVACAPTSGPLPPTSAPTLPAPTAAVATPDARSITLAAVGDVMLGRYVGRRIAALGATYPFSATTSLLKADLLLGNLESPLTSRRAPDALRPGPYRLPADPAAVTGLQAAGFTAVSLANNHALDAGPAGIEEAVQTVKTAGIAPLGVGANRAAAQQPHLLEANGLRIALLAANDIRDPEDAADEGHGWGRAPLDDAFLEQVRAARKDADLVIVMVHWGVEYASQPGLRQRERAAALVAAGADLVLGAHPHVLQPITTIEQNGRRALVAYSLGNFVFDQPFSPETSRSAVLQLTLNRTGVMSYTAAPVSIVNGQPRPLAADTNEYAAVLRDLTISAPVAKVTPTPAPVSQTNAPPIADAEAYAANGSSFAPIPIPSDLPQPGAATEPISATADLRGDGSKLVITVDANGMATLHEGASPDDPVVWQNEAANWRVTQIVPGDADDDGRYEFLLILWKPDANGVLRCHPFMLGWRNGRYRIFWGGSAVSEPIQAAALGNVDGDDHTELVVLEGGAAPDDPTVSLAVWRWHGWGFERLWRTPLKGRRDLRLLDVTGDGTRDIIVSLQH